MAKSMRSTGTGIGIGRHEVFHLLRDKILYLEYKPGQHLKESELCEQLNTGRSPVREAILLLEREGLVDIYPQNGMFVSLIDLTTIRDSAYMRHIVEKQILIGLAENKCKAGVHVEEFLLLQSLAVKRNMSQEYVKNDHMLHSQLFALAGRRGVWAAMERQYLHTIRYNMVDFSFQKKMVESLEEHRQIVRHIESGDIQSLAEILEIHHDSDLACADEYVAAYGEYFTNTGGGQ